MSRPAHPDADRRPQPADRPRGQVAAGCLRVLRAGMLALLVLAPCQYSIEVFSRAHVSPADPLVWGLFGLWLACHRLQRRPIAELCPPLIMALVLATASASLAHATHRLATVRELVQLAEYFLAAFLTLRSLLRDAAFRIVAIRVFLAVATAIIALSACQYLRPEVDDFAVRGTFGNSNVLGGYMALALPLALGVLLHTSVRVERVWAAALILGGLAVNLSGGSMLALAVAGCWQAALRGSRVLVAALIAVLLATVLLPALPRHNSERLVQSIALYTPDVEVSSRYREWEAAVLMTREKIWTGVGIGNYQANIGAYYGAIPSPARPAEHDSQNLFLVLAASGGLPLLLAFFGMLVDAMRRGVQAGIRTTDPSVRPAAYGAAAGLLAFCIAGVWSPLLVRGLGIPLAFLLALTVVTDEQAEPRER